MASVCYCAFSNTYRLPLTRYAPPPKIHTDTHRKGLFTESVLIHQITRPGRLLVLCEAEPSGHINAAIRQC